MSSAVSSGLWEGWKTFGQLIPGPNGERGLAFQIGFDEVLEALLGVSYRPRIGVQGFRYGPVCVCSNWVRQ